MFQIYFYTLKIAVFSTLIAAVIGLVTSFFTANRKFYGRRLLLSLSAIPLCIPPLIVALGYVGFWGVNGFVNKLFGTNFSFLYSTLGIVIAQGFYNFPLVTGIVTDAWQKLPSEQASAASLLGANRCRVFFTVTLHQLSGAIAAACIPVFLFSFFSFMIVMLFSPPGQSTLEVEIYHSIRSTLDIRSGAKLAVTETSTALGIVALYSFIIRKSQSSSTGIDFVVQPEKRLGREIFIFIPIICMILIFFAFPFISVFVSGLASVTKLFASPTFWSAARNSVLTGFCTGFLCTFLAFFYSLFIKLSRRQGNFILQTLPIIPMAISSVVISWGASLIFRKGNVFMLIALQTFLYWPVAYRHVQSGINRLTPETDMAAAILSRGLFDSILRVYIPECMPILLSSFGFCFAMSLGDATIPLVLSIRGFSTLALYTYNLAGAYRFNQACACGGIVALISMIIFFTKRGSR